MWTTDVPEPEEGSDEQIDPVPLMDRSCVANVLEKVSACLVLGLVLRKRFDAVSRSLEEIDHNRSWGSVITNFSTSG